MNLKFWVVVNEVIEFNIFKHTYMILTFSCEPKTGKLQNMRERDTWPPIYWPSVNLQTGISFEIQICWPNVFLSFYTMATKLFSNLFAVLAVTAVL